MKKFDFKKFLSRKFLISMVGVIVGLAISLGASASEIQEIAGAIVSAVSAISYIFGEAMVDAAAVKKNEKTEEDEIKEDGDSVVKIDLFGDDGK